MVKFNKIFGFAGLATVFAGMAFGQATCVIVPGGSTTQIRAEGTTELVAQTAISCNNSAAAGNISIQDFVSLPVTSKVLTTVVSGAVPAGGTEAVALVTTGNFLGGAGASAILSTTYGTIGANGSTLNFQNIPAIPATNFWITFQNVRVNASTQALGTGAPPAVTESFFITGPATVVNSASIPATPQTVAFVSSGISSKAFKGLASGGGSISASAGGNSLVICTGYTPVSSTATVAVGLSTVLQINEGFQNAWKVLGATPTTGEGPQSVQAVGAVSNAANSGTRIKIVFNNVPTGVNIYLPVTVTNFGVNGTAQISLTTSETGVINAPTPLTPATSNGLMSSSGATFAQPTVLGTVAAGAAGNSVGLAAVSISGGTGTAVYEVTNDGGLTTLDTFNVGVWVYTVSNTVAGSATAITEQVSFAPVGSTNLPNFAVGASTTTLTGSTFSLCTTSLLFPFVTNQLGFDTGIAISNTSSDPFGTKGATAQAGTCSLSFYGSNAPTPATVTTPNVATGTTYTTVVSGLAPNFQGYAIAQCSFQFAHAFAFLTNAGSAGPAAIAQGYSALVIPDTNQVARSANSNGAAGQGEILGQ